MTLAASTTAIVVAQRSELAAPGIVLRRRAADRDVLLIWAGDTIVAVAAECTHACGPLTDESLTPRGLRCAWHGSTFDPITGAVVRGPARKPLVTFDVVVAGTDVLVMIPD